MFSLCNIESVVLLSIFFFIREGKKVGELVESFDFTGDKAKKPKYTYRKSPEFLSLLHGM